MAGWLSCRRALLPGLAFAGVWLLPWPLTIDFDALESMSHPGAREALERLARSQDQDVRSLAQKALGGR